MGYDKEDKEEMAGAVKEAAGQILAVDELEEIGKEQQEVAARTKREEKPCPEEIPDPG